MAKIRDVPLGTYPSGTYNFGPHATPLGLNGFDVRIGRCTTATPTLWSNPATTVFIDMQFSYDGGVTYTPLGQNTSGPVGGGIMVDRGVEVPEHICSWRFSPNEPTHLKGQVTVANGPITSYVDVTISE